MRQDAGSCNPEQLYMVQQTFDCTALIVISITSVVLIALAIVGDGLGAPNVTADLSLVTVISKNQLRPTIAELETHAAQAGSKGEANGDEGLVMQRQGQWI
jgi:hypothetical protein